MIAIRRFSVLLIVAATVLAGCTVSTNAEPVALGEDLFEPVLTTTTTTTSTTTPEAVTKTVTVYFLRVSDGTTTLEGVPREVDVGAASQEILNNLFTQRPNPTERPAENGLTSAIPESAELLSAANVPGTTRLIVDVRGLFGEGGIQGTPLRNALAQIVWTATQSSGVSEVSFRNDGEPVLAVVGSGETSDQPVGRSDYQSLT